jgi:betaine-aldehyde dehydrogenase
MPLAAGSCERQSCLLDKEIPMVTPNLKFHPRGLFVNGSWTDSIEGQTFEVVNPSNLERLPDVPLASTADVDRAVQAATSALREWRRVSTAERARCVELLAKRIEEHAEDLALMDAVDSGNAIAGMRADMRWTVETLRYFAGLATEIKGETKTLEARHLNLTLRQPFGVVAKISPFNHPFRFCAEKVAAPLIAGNCLVIKGSEQAPLSSLMLGELCEGLFPLGVVNILTGDGQCGEALVRHPGVARVGFVGSVPTGIAIARAAAETLKRVSLELGGKNPIIIFPDADPKQAAIAAIKGMNMNRQGQSCSSTSRVLVHASLCEAVLAELVDQAKALTIGLPWVEGNELGPIVSQRQFDRVRTYIDEASVKGHVWSVAGNGPRHRSSAPVTSLSPPFSMECARKCASLRKKSSGRSCPCWSGLTSRKCC